MNNKIYMFYNGEELPAPGHHDLWSNFTNPDAVKMAIVSTALWEKREWEVERVTTTPTNGFKFSGRLVEPVTRYPYSRWNLWFRLKDLAPCWFTTTDIINNGFHPERSDVEPKPLSVAKGFTTACMFVTREYCEQAIETVRNYDDGKFPALTADLVSDETILRYYGPKILTPDLMSHALAETNWQSKPLWHVPRSVLQHYANQYPPAV